MLQNAMFKTVSPEVGIENAAKQVSRVVVETAGLNFFYGEKQVIFNVDIAINSGEVTALIGPSGCGKSTFLRTLNRMHELTPHARLDGVVLLEGIDIYDRRIDLVTLRKEVGMVFQRSNPFPKSIFDNVAYGPRIHGTRDRSDLEAIVEESLKGADLWLEVKDRLQESAMALSGGQQQRLCIARALAVKPKILLMDEPASALDPRSTSKIEDLIAQLRGKYSIIIVTHNMQQAARVSDRTAFFYEGKLIEFDDTEKIFTNPGEQQTEDYITGRFG